jgi:hypothetical protein
MKPLARTVLVVTLALFAGCDPGMSIRQINSAADSKKTAVVVTPEIAIEVKTTHQLIGEGWYHPEVKVTNSSDSLITITSVELVAQGVTYENKPRGGETYPLTLPVRSTTSLEVAFRFSEGVHKIFKKPAELRIHYLTRGHDGLARTTVVGGPLDAR